MATTHDDVAKYPTANVNLWPRWVVVFMNADRFERLARSQQDALREAVRTARPMTWLLPKASRMRRQRRSASGG